MLTGHVGCSRNFDRRHSPSENTWWSMRIHCRLVAAEFTARFRLPLYFFCLAGGVKRLSLSESEVVVPMPDTWATMMPTSAWSDSETEETDFSSAGLLRRWIRNQSRHISNGLEFHPNLPSRCNEYIFLQWGHGACLLLSPLLGFFCNCG